MNSIVTASHARPARRRPYLPVLVTGLWIWAMMICLAQWGPWIELACHFVLHGCVLWLVVVLGCVWQRRWRLLAGSLLPGCYCLLLFQPWSLWRSPPLHSESDEHSLQVMSWNVLCVNEHLDEMARVIAEHPVDVLVLIEVRPNLFEQLPTIAERYPYRMDFPSWMGNGIAVLTHRQDLTFKRLDFGGANMPSIEVTSADGGLKLVGVHTWSPMPPGRALARDRQLEQLKTWTREQSAAVCVIGDLNITPWAPAFGRLLDAGFVDWRTRGFGNQASWPSWLGPLGIPIDHALTFGQCQLSDRRLGPIVFGSDHRPVLVQVNW